MEMDSFYNIRIIKMSAGYLYQKNAGKHTRIFFYFLYDEIPNRFFKPENGSLKPVLREMKPVSREIISLSREESHKIQVK